MSPSEKKPQYEPRYKPTYIPVYFQFISVALPIENVELTGERTLIYQEDIDEPPQFLNGVSFAKVRLGSYRHQI